jgi:hypothetical protein
VFADEREIHMPVKAENTGGILDKGELRESIVVARTHPGDMYTRPHLQKASV